MLHHVTQHIPHCQLRKSVRLFSLLLFCLAAQVLYSQSPVNSDTTIDADLYKKQGNNQYRNGEIYAAMDSYETYMTLNPGDTKTGYRLANLYFSTRNYEQAKKHYDKVLTFNESKYLEAMYYAGVVSQNMGLYEEAKVYFTTFRRAYRGKKDPNNLRKQAQNHIKSCDWVLENNISESSITIQALDHTINQSHIEFSPYPLNENEIIFGSVRMNEELKYTGFRQLYSAKKRNSTWEFNDILPPAINTPSIHTGNAAVSSDGLRMYFTRCEKNWQEKNICSIWLSKKEDGEWQKAEKLPYPINDETHTSTQPALGISQRTGKDILYFVSDRPGTRGGLDVWYTETNKNTGKFQEPRNLGRNINTPSNDCTPYYDLSGNTLYFSSNGRNGYGGFDIYKTTGSKKRWTETEHLPSPINTSYDDYYFATLPNGNEGFFTSNRPGTNTLGDGSCCDDIFYFKYNECVKVVAEGKIINQTSYDIYDDLNERYNLDLEYPEDKQAMADIPVEVYLSENDEQIFYFQTESDINGEYSLNLDIDKDYVIIIKNFGFFDKKKRISTNAENCFDTLNIGVTQINYLPEITVRVAVYYEHNKSRLSTQASNTLDSLLPLFDLFPNAVIEIGSHTDNTGSDNYNLRLSQRRSESVVTYLLSKGITENRLVAKGYGEQLPIAPNTNPDGSDNPENRQLNRRTELKIVGVIDEFYEDD